MARVLCLLKSKKLNQNGTGRNWRAFCPFRRATFQRIFRQTRSLRNFRLKNTRKKIRGRSVPSEELFFGTFITPPGPRGPQAPHRHPATPTRYDFAASRQPGYDFTASRQPPTTLRQAGSQAELYPLETAVGLRTTPARVVLPEKPMKSDFMP